jgi:hypothetical protein
VHASWAVFRSIIAEMIGRPFGRSRDRSGGLNGRRSILLLALANWTMLENVLAGLADPDTEIEPLIRHMTARPRRRLCCIATTHNAL